MGNLRFSILATLCYLASILNIANGCQIGGDLTLGPVANHITIYDYFRGNVKSETTTDITRIASINFGGALVSSEAYLTITLENGQFVIQTSNAFNQYEENEVAINFSVTVTFECTGGNTMPLILFIHITDTNNNAPEFRPTDTFDFVVTAPLPPGYVLTNCLDEIVVRDIDLTTSGIIFEIEENPYFQIDYDSAPCPAPAVKEYKALLRTSTFIRNFREPITLRVTATDVDATGDPPLSTFGTIRITGNPDFEIPDEPVFSQALYFATYTEGHQLNLADSILLEQGYDESVDFVLDGEFGDNFDVSFVVSLNQVSLTVRTPLDLDTLEVKEIYLILRADKEFTSGGSATIVIQLPEVVQLLFNSAQYSGYIVDNSLELLPLILSQGYEGGTVTAEVVGEYSASFAATVQENLVTIIMTSLADNIIAENNYITIEVEAITGNNMATTIVVLEIIKNDNITPAFDKSIYTGSYDPVNGLSIEQIAFVQGFDESVNVEILGEHHNFFEINDIGPILQLTSSSIPSELFEEQRITLSIEASKPRTVGANAAIVISLPSPRVLGFEEATYMGTLLDNSVIHQTILLTSGYDENVTYQLLGDYSDYFDIVPAQNQVTISLRNPLPNDVITQNTAIILSLVASGLNAITTTTSVFLDVIKEDTTTPVFNQNVYYGTYRGALEFEVENVVLTQGFDDEVSFRLDDSDHAQYFNISRTENGASITLRSSIPEDVVFNEKFLLFTVLADKALTVGSNAAVLIRFPAELTESAIMSFSQNYYIGVYETTTVTLDDIILDTGYTTSTEFELIGEYDEHFILSNNDHVVQIRSNDTNPLPHAIIEDNDFIVFTVEARRERTVSVRTTVVIDIMKEVIIHPVFNRAYYRGSFSEENELQSVDIINLSEGYDETVNFELEGEQSAWFTTTNVGNSVTLVLESQIPQVVLDANNQLLFSILALKENAPTGRAVISIEITRGNLLSFSQDFYKGHIEEGIPSLDLISIDNYEIPATAIPELTGDYSDYFQVTNINGYLRLEVINNLPDQILREHNVFVLTLEIQLENTRISTVIVLEILRNEIDHSALEFERTYYVGSYSQAQGLEFEDAIRTTDADFDTVVFDLDGDDAQWFDLDRQQDSVRLILTDTIPSTVLLRNQLIFEVTANIQNHATGRATIVISLTDQNTDLVLEFNQVSYLGSIENDQATIGPITLGEYVPEVTYELHGDLRDYFTLTPQAESVTVTLGTPIPEQAIPANRIIVLELRASAPQTAPAHATLVFAYVVDNVTTPVVELMFAQPYYTGSYTEEDGLVFTTPISLAEGHDDNVLFTIDGELGQWFALEGPANAQTLILSSPIPGAILLNNQQLVFTVNAERPGSTTVRATIVITLPTEYTDLVLGFDRVTYMGSIENNQTNIGPITLSEGYVPGVTFELHGDLRDYFTLTPQAESVTVTLGTPIPEQAIPANRIIVLELRASAPQTAPAHATLVFAYVVDNVTTPVVELMFAQPYYTGSYTEEDGLVFTTPISLAEGHDDNVLFTIDGELGQWFALEGPANAQTLILSSPIPGAILLNNQQLVFTVNAERPGSTTVRATIVITLPTEYTDLVLGFDRVTYMGSIENNQTNIGPITLSEGYVPGVTFELHGDLRDYFTLTPQAESVTVTLGTPIPEQAIPANRIIVLELRASAPQTAPAHATLVFAYVVNNVTTPVVELMFAQPYYTGSYTEEDGLVFTTPISLAEGHDDNVLFTIDGEQGQWFALEGPANAQTLILSSPIPGAILLNNQQLVFTVNAERPGSTTVRATIVFTLPTEYTDLVLGFDRVTYMGSIENNQTNIGPITLSEGYVPGVTFELHGDLRDYFTLTPQAESVTVTLGTPIPEQAIPANRIIVLELRASAPQTAPAHATLVFAYVVDNVTTPVVELMFAQPYYTGSYTEEFGLVFTTPISLAEGHDDNVLFTIDGEQGQWFALEGPANAQTLILTSPIPGAILLNNQQLVFTVNAERPGSTTVRATIVITLPTEYTDLVLGFDRVTYMGSIENNQTNIGPITLSEGYVPGVTFELHGDLRDYFTLTPQAESVTVTLGTPIPEQAIPANWIIVLELRASAPQTAPAHATLVFAYVVDNVTTPVVELMFAQPYYTGSYTEEDGLVFTTPISLAEGHDDNVLFTIDGELGQWFALEGPANAQTLILSSPIPGAILLNNQQLVFTVNAERPGSTTIQATIVIDLPATDLQPGTDESFNKLLLEGSIHGGVVSHEPITITGFEGSRVELFGEYAPLFDADLLNGEVTVRAAESVPSGVTHLAIELHAGSARAVLLLDIEQSDPTPTVPVVTFSSPSYAVRVTIADSGDVGQVEAFADNGEALRYSLVLDNEHLQERLSINDAGALHLSDPVSPGVYTARVVATTVFTQESGTAMVHLTSEIVVPPLIVLDRDEEEPHYNLINSHEGCQFTLANRWPLDQTWLYVDETGLHTTAIDREHESIAFMALSQVQVEITLHCGSDTTRVKRELSALNRVSDQADYGFSRWVLTDSISYDSRRSLVNLVVNDINDNAPVFVGKEREPIAVGYPVTDLEERVLPRSLAELQATDADIGENAALLYWSNDPALAVAPTTGFVHVRDGVTLEHDARLTVYATDRNGHTDGLTGSIDIIVKLLDQSNIAVVTIRDAFLDDESDIISQLRESVGYEIKVLRSIVISNFDTNEATTRTKRDVTGTGASLQLYLYGLIDREPVSIEQLTTDITNAIIAQVIVASTVSLQDHLTAQEICVISGRDTGLLVATIILSVLLFIMIVLILIWVFLRWRKNQNYEQFSDANSVASRIEPAEPLPKPLEAMTKPRLNIEELKKSERRLQERLDAPIPEITVEPMPLRKDAVLNMPIPKDQNASIVIQSIDKLKTADDSSDDEYGERQRAKRKSVVTFNENVEKIIHIEDPYAPVDDEKSGYEVYKF